MSTTHGPIEPTGGVHPGAVPQPPRAVIAAEPADSFSRSGDTDVVFRLDRHLPLAHRLRVLTENAGEWLLDNWRMVAAGVVGLLALGFLATLMGGAYGHRPPAPAPAAALPVPPPPATAPITPVPTTAVAAPAEVAPTPHPTRPARPRAHPTGPRGSAKKAVATQQRSGAPRAHRPR